MISKHPLLPRCLGDSLSFRNSVLFELQKKLAEQDERDERVLEALAARVPESFKKYLEDEGVLNVVRRYGKYSTNINFQDDTYGFGDMEDVRTKVGDLKKAWKDIIDIELSRPEIDRVDIYFSATL